MLKSTRPVDREIDLSEHRQLIELQELDKLERVASYKWARAFAHAVKQACSSALMTWVCPQSIIARPLLPTERRRRHPKTGRWVIANLPTKTFLEEVLPSFLPMLLVLHMDQCSVGRTVVHFAQFVMRLMLDSLWDPYHMLWNALKRGIMKACGKYWRSVLLLQTRCNVSYGPWNHHDHKYTRKDAWEELIRGATRESECFQENLAMFAFDMELQTLPRSVQDEEALFQKIVARAKACKQMGPLHIREPLVHHFGWPRVPRR